MEENNDIRKLPGQEKRVETGPVQFGDDWPGVFIRGDNAAYYAMMLKMQLNGQGDWLSKGVIEGLYKTLCSCIVGTAKDMFKIND